MKVFEGAITKVAALGGEIFQYLWWRWVLVPITRYFVRPGSQVSGEAPRPCFVGNTHARFL